MKNIIKRLLSVMLAASLCTGLFSANAQQADAPLPTESEIVDAPLSSASMVFLQNGMRAVSLTPSVDFCREEMTDMELAGELTSLYEEVAGYGMNAVMIDAQHDGNVYYNLEINSASGGVLGAAVDAARSAGLYVYVSLDVAAFTAEVCGQGGGLKSGFSAAVHKFAMKYACDGIVLENYYTQNTPEMYAEYMHSGSGIGYENWLYETNEYIIRTISDVVRRTNNTVAVGLLISDMWANSSTNELGSDTADIVQALYDGYCDTKGYVEKGYADFTLVQAYGSTSDTSLNFEKVMSWWYDLAETTGTRVYMLHMNERIGQYAGWYEDQLLRQLTVMEDYPDCGGSMFNSMASLRANPLRTTDTLLKYFQDKINTETIFEDLVMISPTSNSFVTYDNSVKFMGTFDENFDVYFDGKKIKLNEAGNFYFQENLKVGWNSFVIEHKGKQSKYSIERRVDVLKSIEQTSDIIVEGGTKICLVAIAYSGSKVTATIGSKTIKLTEKAGSTEEIDANSSYAEFVGYYKVGEGIVDKEQYLGEISINAAYSGYEETITGGNVTIAAKPKPVTDIKVEIKQNQSSLGTGEVVGTMNPVLSDTEYVNYVKVLNNYTIVYDGKTTGGIQSPLFAQLPAGTLDYIKSSSGGYITTTSGKRFAADTVTTFTDTGLGYNSLLVKAVGNMGGKSFIKLHLDYKSSFNITVPVTYHDDLDGPYGVESFDASYIYITFDNITSVTKLPSFEYCSLFSEGTWETVEQDGVPKFRLALKLRQAGIYSGCGAYYDENGDLILSFTVPTSSLAGKVIVIDPGHGYGRVPDKLDPGGIGNVTEQSVNLAVSKLLEQKLTALGATVVRLKTESEFILTNTRPTVARAYGADMYLSLHCNSVENNPDAHGVEVYYFTPFSQPLARAINNELVGYYESVYADGTQCNRGDKYSYYWVTLQQDFPSVLVEMGFVSNERECMIMANPTYQEGIAKSIANGVYAYFARSGLTYSGSGSSDVPNVPDTPVTPPTPTDDPPTDVPDTPSIPVTDEPSVPDEPDTPDEPSETDEPSGTDEPDEPETPPETGEPDEPTVPDNPGGGIRVE